jgi:hypothetical protein
MVEKPLYLFHYSESKFGHEYEILDGTTPPPPSNGIEQNVFCTYLVWFCQLKRFVFLTKQKKLVVRLFFRPYALVLHRLFVIICALAYENLAFKYVICQ